MSGGRTPHAVAADGCGGAVFVSDAAMRIEASGRQALAGMVRRETQLRTLILAALKRASSKMTPVNTVALRQRIADRDGGAARIRLLNRMQGAEQAPPYTWTSAFPDRRGRACSAPNNCTLHSCTRHGTLHPARLHPAPG